MGGELGHLRVHLYAGMCAFRMCIFCMHVPVGVERVYAYARVLRTFALGLPPTPRCDWLEVEWYVRVSNDGGYQRPAGALAGTQWL